MQDIPVYRPSLADKLRWKWSPIGDTLSTFCFWLARRFSGNLLDELDDWMLQYYIHIDWHKTPHDSCNYCARTKWPRPIPVYRKLFKLISLWLYDCGSVRYGRLSYWLASRLAVLADWINPDYFDWRIEVGIPDERKHSTDDTYNRFPF